MLKNECMLRDSAEGKRYDAQEMAKILRKLPDAEREKLFYMMKGIELMVDAEKKLGA